MKSVLPDACVYLIKGLIQSIKYMRDKGLGIRRIASELSVGVGTVYKVLEADTV